jgi:hypothetical protein
MGIMISPSTIKAKKTASDPESEFWSEASRGRFPRRVATRRIKSRGAGHPQKNRLAALAVIALLSLSVFAAGIAGQGPIQASAPAQAVTITAGPEWVPLNLELDVQPGTALDFSRMRFQDPPAGKHGRVIARPDGQFAFEKDPGTPRRFYGVNLCFGGQYLTHEESDRLADRFMRLGYNTVRLHHYEGLLAQGQPNTTSFNPGQLDKLDYLVAALARRGIYITTDLFTSRPVTFREIGESRDGPVGMDHFKILIPVHPGAWENWKQFSRALLGHVNPYTGRSWAEEPALAWLSMINEGNFGNFYADLRTIPDWTAEWNVWLKKKYPDRDALSAAWSGELKEDEDPTKGSVRLPDTLMARTPRARDCNLFLAFTETGLIERMKNFLRNELGCRALITNCNSWTNFPTSQGARRLYDYVDDHFYVDHPVFLQKSWQLPSRSPNTSPVVRGAPGGRDRSFTRLFDKPFTITEYNYSAPGRFRGVGGILTGALGALQGWAGIWRFAYSHNHDALFQPSRMGYFDMASDPLGQASERASLCLFLRGDMAMGPHSVAVTMTPADLEAPPMRIPALAPRWHWAAWLTRIGMQIVPDPSAALPFSAILPLGWKSSPADYSAAKPSADLQPYEADDGKILALLKDKRIVAGAHGTDPARNFFTSETGEITLDGPRDTMILDTPRTAGGYAPAAQRILTRDGGLSITLAGADATVWISSLDGRPLRKSRRMLVTHLTDLQNTGIKYAEEARQTLLEWGSLPHLVRAGKASVEIKLEGATKFKVWALSTSGRRLAEVKSNGRGGVLRFETDVAADPAAGARMLYEIARR